VSLLKTICILSVMVTLLVGATSAVMDCYNCISLSKDKEKDCQEKGNWKVMSNCQSCLAAEATVGDLTGKVRACNLLTTCKDKDDAAWKKIFVGVTVEGGIACCETDKCNSAPGMDKLNVVLFLASNLILAFFMFK